MGMRLVVMFLLEMLRTGVEPARREDTGSSGRRVYQFRHLSVVGEVGFEPTAS